MKHSNLAIYLLFNAVLFLFFQRSGIAGEEVNPSAVLLIAHRGGLFEEVPENTLAAIRMAISSGADLIELDLRSSRDGQIMIMHDPTLDRTTNGSGDISDYTADVLKEIDAGNGEKIPNFEETLAVIEGTQVKLVLDIKKSPLLDIKKVVNLVEKHRKSLDVIAGVRSIEDLNTFKKLNPNIRTLGFISGFDQINTFIDSGVDIIRLWPAWIKDNPRVVSEIRKLNVPVWVTVSDISGNELRDFVKQGVTGFITDFPSKFKLMLENIIKN